MIPGWRCAVCGTEVDVATPLAWRCPRATRTDRYHVLHPVDLGGAAGVDGDGPAPGDNPFVVHGARLAWTAFATANGLDADACARITDEVAGGFVTTPYGPSAELSERLGLDLWVKDETGGVAGSHKARHLATILMHLRAAESIGALTERPRLAIASCGNAALAAATLARRVDWPLDVYVPVWMDDAFGVLLDDLGAAIHRCERRADDPPGDPAMHRFRDAVDEGSVPFSVQGPENAYCLDGGRTLGWEMAGHPPQAVAVQVGGGALATCLGMALGPTTTLVPVQAEGCAPFATAWDRAVGIADPARHWAEVMTPWPHPSSLADGILDDETYDWIGVFRAARDSGGHPVVVTEEHVVEAHELAQSAGFDASYTGSAGLAGVLAAADELRGRRVAVVMSGVAR